MVIEWIFSIDYISKSRSKGRSKGRSKAKSKGKSSRGSRSRRWNR